MPTHFAICILARKGPRDAASFCVTALLPSGDFGSEQCASRHPAVKALPIKDTDFDFRHVEPTGVHRGVVKDDASEQVSSRGYAEHVFETYSKVSVEVIENQMD